MYTFSKKIISIILSLQTIVLTGCTNNNSNQALEIINAIVTNAKSEIFIDNLVKENTHIIAENDLTVDIVEGNDIKLTFKKPIVNVSQLMKTFGEPMIHNKENTLSIYFTRTDSQYSVNCLFYKDTKLYQRQRMKIISFWTGENYKTEKIKCQNIHIQANNQSLSI